MKRWLAAVIVAAYFMVLFLPLFPRFWSASPLRAPERRESVVPFVEFRSGRRVEFPMEEYVLRVMATEMDPRFPDQVLAAQAIIVRTYTLRRLEMGDVATDDIATFRAALWRRSVQR